MLLDAGAGVPGFDRVCLAMRMINLARWWRLKKKVGGRKKKKKRVTNEWKETREVEKSRTEARTRQAMGHSSEGADVGFGYQRHRRGYDCPKAEREIMLMVCNEVFEQESGVTENVHCVKNLPAF